jgi:hypothetical protein
LNIYQCKNCGKSYTYDPYECFECESVENFQVVTDYNKLMQFAEENKDRIEDKHIYADAALYFFVKEVNPLLAKRYEQIRKTGFYFA